MARAIRISEFSSSNYIDHARRILQTLHSISLELECNSHDIFIFGIYDLITWSRLLREGSI